MNNGIPSAHPIQVRWDGGKRYLGGVPDGPEILLDGSRQSGPSPVDGVLVSLAACSAIDVVEILEKRRTPVQSLEVRCDFSRAENPPRRLTRIHLTFRVETSSERTHVDRAIDLSIEKYCSVASSLAPDTEITWTAEVVSPSQEVSG